MTNKRTLEKIDSSRHFPPEKRRKQIFANKIIPSKSLIEDEDVKLEIIRLFNTHWPAVKISNGKLWNPSPNPISLDLHTLSGIKPQNYLVAEKTDGVRYMFILLKNPKTKKNIALMMDRACRLYEVSVCAKSRYFEGSIFDGELVYDFDGGEQLAYYIFDAVCIANNNIASLNLTERRRHINHVITIDEQVLQTGMYQEKKQRAESLAQQGKIVPLFNNYEEIIFKAKDMFPLIDTKRVLSLKMNHKCDGLIFTPIEDPVRNNTHWNCFKWKMNHTLDLSMNLLKTEMSNKQDTRNNCGYKCKLYFGDDRNLMTRVHKLPLRNACRGFLYHNNIESLKLINTGVEAVNEQCKTIYFIPDLQSKLFAELISELEASESTPQIDIIGEFELERVTDQLRIENYLSHMKENGVYAHQLPDGKEIAQVLIQCKLIRIRNDKDVPNNFRTVQQTVLNLEEGITANDLVQCITTNKRKSKTCN